MATPTASRRRAAQVINLISSDEEDSDDADAPIQRLPRRSRPQQDPQPVLTPADETVPENGHALGGAPLADFDYMFDFDDALPGAFPATAEAPATPEDGDENTPALEQQGGQIINIDGEDVFIPDSPGPVARPAPSSNRDEPDQEVALDNTNFTADDCLQRILFIFPDINHEHVHKLYNDFDNDGAYQSLPGPSRFENIVEKLVSAGSYPKQDKGKQALKRKREDGDEDADAKRWEGPDREILPSTLRKYMAAMLRAEFPEIPLGTIYQELVTHRHLYQTYVALAHMKDTSNAGKKWRERRSGRDHVDSDTIASNSGMVALGDELKAARKKVKGIRAQRAADDVKKQAEQENLQCAMKAGATAECQACFEVLPMNRSIHCNGDIAHFTCFDCALTYIKSEVGESRCRVLCTAGCGAAFSHDQLHRLKDRQLLEKLAQLQQEKDIRDAGLDNLEECPFCDYKAILPPVEEDFEFRCAKPECEKISCRRCKSISHIPVSCEEHSKDNKINNRHKIEEAMTAALIRSCNKCKKQFIKEQGCNKMACSSCGNLQCYVCSASLKDYLHFAQNPTDAPDGNGRKCPLYDNVHARHEREVKEAEAAARAQVLEDNPDVSHDDLEIKVSDRVKKATADRIKANAGVPGAMPGLGHPADLRPGADRAGYGGPFAMPDHLGRLRAGAGADFDEDGEDDDEDHNPFDGFLDRMPPRARPARQHIHRDPPDRDAARIRLLAIRQQLARNELPNFAPARDPRLDQVMPGAADHLQQQAAAQQRAQMAGYLRAFDMQPMRNANYNLGPPPVQPANHALAQQGQQLNAFPGFDDMPDMLDAFNEEPFDRANNNPLAARRLRAAPPIPMPGPIEGHGPALLDNFALMQQMARNHRTQALEQQQQQQAPWTVHNRAGGIGEVHQRHARDPRRRQEGMGTPSKPRVG